MKFIVDEQLPSLLAEWLISKGFDAIHIADLSTGFSTTDKEIRKISMLEKRIVITKDEDFFNSYIFQKEPYKLIFITTGNIKNRALLDIFRNNWVEIELILTQNDVLEINRETLKIWY